MFSVRSFALAVAVAGVLALPSTTSAATITFEDVAVSAGTNDIAGDRVSGGFTFDSLTNHTHLTNNSFDAYNNSTFLVSDDFFGPTTLTMSAIGGSLFSLSQLDIAEWELGERATTVRVTGVGNGNPTLDIVIDGIGDGPGALNDFQTVLFGAQWTNLSSVIFDAQAGFGSQYFALDNIVVNQSSAAVPEPTSMLLLGTGLIGALRARRRRA